MAHRQANSFRLTLTLEEDLIDRQNDDAGTNIAVTISGDSDDDGNPNIAKQISGHYMDRLEPIGFLDQARRFA